jgi:hypothetical protein
MRVKLVGTLGAIARRQNAVEDNKAIELFINFKLNYFLFY